MSKTLPFSRILQSKRNEKLPPTPPSRSLFLSLSFLVVYSPITLTFDFGLVWSYSTWFNQGLLSLSEFLVEWFVFVWSSQLWHSLGDTWWEHQTPERFRHNRRFLDKMCSDGREARLPATFVTKKSVTKSFVLVKANKYLRKYS